MASTLCKTMGLKELCFLFKSSNFVHFVPYDLVQISPACSPKYVSNNVGRDFRFPVIAFATVARKTKFCFKGKFTAKIDFLIGDFRLPLLTLTLEV